MARPNLRLVARASDIELSVKGRLPPHDLDAEAAVLSAVLLDPSAARIFDLLRHEHFYSDANGRIYRAAAWLHERGQPIDLVTVCSRLRADGRLAEIGGPSYVGQLADMSPSVANLEAHAAIVYEHAMQREATAAIWALLAEAYSPPIPGPAWRDQAAARLNDIAQQGQRTKAISVRDAAARVLKRYEHAQDNPGTMVGLKTGIASVDEATGGLHAPEVTLVCAVEKKGKSALAASIAMNVAEHSGGVMIFSVDSMTADSITERMACGKQRVDSVKLKNGLARQEDWSKLTAGLAEISTYPIMIDEDTSLTPLVLRAKLRAAQAVLRREWKVELVLVVVDYVQLLNCDAVEPGMNEEQKLNRIGKSLLRTAEIFNVPMLALSQINEKGDTRDAKALQQHFQNKWSIHWKPAERRTEIPGIKRGPEPHCATILIELTRSGKPGPCSTFFHQTYTRFSDESR